MIAVVSVEAHDDDPGGLRTYEVRINSQVMGTFQHERRKGLAECLRAAAKAVDAEVEKEFYRLMEQLGATGIDGETESERERAEVDRPAS